MSIPNRSLRHIGGKSGRKGILPAFSLTGESRKSILSSMLVRFIYCMCTLVLAFVLGWALYPLLFPRQEVTVSHQEEKAPEIVREAPEKAEAEEEPEIVQAEEEEDTPPPPEEKKQAVAHDTSVKMPRRTKSGRSHVARYVAKLLKKKEKDGAYTAADLSASDWADPSSIEEKMDARLSRGMGDCSDKALFEFLSDPQNRLDLARLDFIRTIGASALKQLTKETPAAAEMLAAMGGDLNWLENFMYSGPVKQGAAALKTLSMLVESDPDILREDTLRRIASTVALEFARNNWSGERALARYKYYAESWRGRKLNKNFDHLRYWETRIITGCASLDAFGDEKSLAWQRDNVRLPASLYTGAGGQVPYRLLGVAGDTVFNENYYRPFRPYFDDIQAEITREVGAVCGGVSHFGAYAALANGVPAMTMGEPGHCSYAVRVNGKWKKCNSIYWKKSPGWGIFGERTWDFLLLTDDLYSDFGRTLISDEARALARFFASRGKIKLALNTFELALLAQPLNYPAWEEAAAAFSVHAPRDLDWWRDLHDLALQGLSANHGEACATLLRKSIYPVLSPLMKDRRALMNLYTDFLKSQEDMGDNRWDIGPLLTSEFNSIANNKKDKIYYLQQVLRIFLEKPAFAGPALAWGLEATSSPDQDEEVEEAFQRMVLSAMRMSKRGDKDMWETCGEAMYTASANKDRATFQAIGKLVGKKYKNKFPKKKPRFKGFSGMVVSEKGLISSGATIDPGGNVCLQWGVLQPTGGAIEVKFTGELGVTVELETPCKLNGVVLVFPSREAVVNPAMYGAGGASAGARPFHVRVSDNGTDWVKVATIENPDAAALRFDLRRTQPRARYVQVVRDGDMIMTNVTGFYVYGRSIR